MKENPNTLYRKNFNQTRCNTPTRKRISEVESRIAEWDKHHAGIAQSNFAKYGTGKLAPEGTVVRLSGVPYPKLKNISSGDIKSFYYGYYDRGNTNIRILIETGSTSIPLLTDNITKVYQEINKTFGLKRKEMPYEELDEETKYNEILRVIGFNDGKNSEIAFDSLNEVIRNCIPYREGYELGKHLREDIDYQNMASKGMRR